jgi:hypothetical protein
VLPFGPLEHSVQLFTQFDHFPLMYRDSGSNFGVCSKLTQPACRHSAHIGVAESLGKQAYQFFITSITLSNVLGIKGTAPVFLMFIYRDRIASAQE